MADQPKEEEISRTLLYLNGRPVGVAKANADTNQITCTFDIRSMTIQEVLDLFWLDSTDQIHIGVAKHEDVQAPQ